MTDRRRIVIRRGHWRNQRYGPARALIKRIYVQPVRVTLPLSASRQLDMLDAMGAKPADDDPDDQG